MVKWKLAFFKKLFATIFLIVTFFNIIVGQIEVHEEPKMLYYEMTHERIKNFWLMKNMRDVFHKDKYLLGRNRIIGNVSYNTGRVVVSNGSESHNETRSALSYFFRFRFFEEFSLNATFYQDFNPRASAPWIANYTYSIGRYDWRPNKFNFGYENYMNNRYSDTYDMFLKKLTQGYFYLSYNHNLTGKIIDKISLDNTTNLKFFYFLRYAIKYEDAYKEIQGGFLKGKLTIGTAVRFTIYKNIYAEGGLYGYLKYSQKVPWDPDYSYGFGYFDWRSFRISVTYGNWAVNRFPWNKTQYPYYGFKDGNFRITANWIW